MDSSLLLLIKQLDADERLMFQSQYDDSKKSVAVGVLLALFLGGLGIHWFYLENSGRGVCYLVGNIIGWVLTVVFIGWFLVLLVGFACVFDAIVMGDTVRKFNREKGRKIFNEIMLLRNHDNDLPLPPSL